MAVIVETGFTGVAQSLKNPRVGWHQEPGSIAATNAASGFPAANAFTPLTYTGWKPSSAPASLRITFDAAASPSYLAIAAHTIADEGATVTVRKLVGGIWSDWGGNTSITPATNDAILFLLEPQAVDGIGIEVTGGTPIIGVLRAGDVMEWPRRAMWTGLPITESRQFRYNVNQSESGNWLGRTQVSDGLEFQVQIDNLSEAYRTGDFKDFAAHCNTGDATFFIAPRPLDYEDEVAYAWSNDTVRMNRDLPNKAGSGAVQLSLRGYKEP